MNWSARVYRFCVHETEYTHAHCASISTSVHMSAHVIECVPGSVWAIARLRWWRACERACVRASPRESSVGEIPNRKPLLITTRTTLFNVIQLLSLDRSLYQINLRSSAPKPSYMFSLLSQTFSSISSFMYSINTIVAAAGTPSPRLVPRARSRTHPRTNGPFFLNLFHQRQVIEGRFRVVEFHSWHKNVSSYEDKRERREALFLASPAVTISWTRINIHIHTYGVYSKFKEL